MERSIRLLLILLILLVLPAHPCAATSVLNVSKVVQVLSPSNWSRARLFCRSHYSDLVTIRNLQEAKSLAFFEGWIGLKRWPNRFKSWRWSKGVEIPTFLLWDSDEPARHKNCALKHQSGQNWISDHCNVHHPFLCVDERMIVVQENKTWEEALLHCRELGVGLASVETSHSYHLASLPEEKNRILDIDTIEKNATDEVWVGLRFLAGEWVWLSGERVTSSYLPLCPSQQQHCGALDPRTTQWKTLDCSERRNFLCSMKRERNYI